jgi:SAM-dependent methyltransferase
MWNCPVCSGKTRRALCVRTEFHVRECRPCGHRFAELAPQADHVSGVYADSYFFGGGAGYPDYLREGRILRAHGSQYARRIRPYASPGSMLDIGAAAGFLCDGFRSEGWCTEGLEPNETMAAYGRNELKLCLRTGTLEQLENTRTFDLVSMIQVVAHFTDLRRAFTRAADATRNGGFWLIETWNNRSMTARLFGPHWHEYNPPSVLHYFSKRSLTLLAAQFGFHPVASGRPPKRILWEHVRSILSHQMKAAWFDRVSRVIPDTTVIPYPSEDLFWILLQKRSIT